MSVTRHHAEWLSLVEVSGPFLAMRVLSDAFPQGLDNVAPELRQRLQVAHEEWLDNQEGLRPDQAIHRAFIRYVLREALGYEDRDLAEGQALPASLAVSVPEHHETLRPTYAVLEPEGRENAGVPRLLIDVLPPKQDLDKTLAGKIWKASPATRMMMLLHGASGASSDTKKGPRLGLVTNGHHFMLVHAVPGETTTYASFYTHLFFEEPLTLRAFTSLLSLRRLFGPESETLESLFAASAQDQQEVTDQLGHQVRRAVEVLVQAIDRVDRDRGRALLKGVDEEYLYQAAVTVMMRLVFLLAAEERRLLLLGNELYDQHYAVSTLRDQLQEVADKHGEEVLERRYAAWSRLLATFRAVFGGVWHESFTLPAYGGSLFDPDRFPFLEGRPTGSSWKTFTGLAPLPIDDRTVLHLLRSIQLLEMRVGGGRTEARRLSFRAIGVEQIGHVYEGLLDHTAKRARGLVLSLEGKNEPELEIAELDKKRAEGQDALVEWLVDATGRSKNAVAKALEYKVPKEDARRLLMACENREPLYGRVSPWAGLVRKDSSGNPVIIHEGGIYVTEGAERRATGTHYTPPTLTEPIVQHTLDPLVYEGPAEGWPREAWKLKSPRAILSLRVCDLAMGSGAFLVQACRYLSERLVEAWENAEREAGGKLIITPEGELSKGDPAERPLAIDVEERLTIARRYVADRCLYGVDKNPMAVEMAKLSLWLVTLQKDRPFTFLNHALQCGDSLLGLTSLDQVEHFHMDPVRGKEIHENLFNVTKVLRPAVEKAIALRKAIEARATETMQDAEEKARLLSEARRATEDVRLVADLVIGAALSTAIKGEKALDKRLEELAPFVAEMLRPGTAEKERERLREDLRQKARAMLEEGRGPRHPERRPFHWAIEFPEVWEDGGFSAFVGNPPFLKGHFISGQLGQDYREFIATAYAHGRAGLADLVSFFFVRAQVFLRSPGLCGLLSTNSIAEGDSSSVALASVNDRGCAIVGAKTNVPWSGDAAVVVSVMWIFKGNWLGQCLLNGQPRQVISHRLQEDNDHRYALAENAGLSFNGFYPNGDGFILDPEESVEWSHDPAYRGVIFAYLTGAELYSYPEQLPRRRAIFFFDWPLDSVMAFRSAYDRLSRTVKPYRAGVGRERRAENWWLYGENNPGLAHALGMGQNFIKHPTSWNSAHKSPTKVIVKTKTSQTWAFARIDARTIFDQTIVVIAIDSIDLWAVLQSSVHWTWCLDVSTTHKTDMRYSPTLFGSFPRPTIIDTMSGLGVVGAKCHQYRGSVMLERNEGLTKTYNRFHNPDERSADIQTLRDLHIEMDLAVAAAYDWTDLRLDHGFHDTKQGKRFTISEPARRKVLNLLLELNHQRYAEEVAAGLHDKNAKKKTAKTTKPSASPISPPNAPPTPQLGLFAANPTPIAAPNPPQLPTTPELTPTEKLLHETLRTAYLPLSKSEILSMTGLAEPAYKTALDRLKSAGLVEQIGERRGAKYRLAARREQSS